MMVEIPLPPTMQKYTYTFTPPADGVIKMFTGSIYSEDIVVSVWRIEKDGTKSLVHADVSIPCAGQVHVKFAPYDPASPLSMKTGQFSYRVVVMG